MDSGIQAQLLSIPVASLSSLFLYAGLSKFHFLRDFRTSILGVPYVTPKIATVLMLTIPILELGGGLGMFFGMSWAPIIVGLLLAGMSLVALLAHILKLDIPCVCFTSHASNRLSAVTALRNAILLIIVFLAPLTPAPIKSLYVVSMGIAFLFAYLFVTYSRQTSKDLDAIVGPQ